jgi:hypothetical protein
MPGRGDPLADDKHVGVVEDRVRVVHRQHGRVPEHDRLASLRRSCCHGEILHCEVQVRTPADA